MVKRIQFVFPLIILVSSVLSAQEILRVSDQLYTPVRLVTLNDKMYYVEKDSAGTNIWQYDGINAPVRYSDFKNIDFGFPFLSHAVEYHNKIYISLQEGHSSSDLWRFDGINPPEQITALSGFLSSPRLFTVAGNKLYFNADDQVHGEELWVYDEVNPPHMVADILSGNDQLGISSNPYYLTAFKDRICFVAEDGVHGNELWEYDGLNPAHLIRDINEGSEGSYISALKTFSDKLYFTADDGIHGRELWVYDGSHDPFMICDLYQGPVSSNPNSLVVFKDKLYFNAEDNVHGARLWSFDGVNQPSMVSEIYKAVDGNSPVIFNEKLFFAGMDEYDNGELWEYDGISQPVRTFAFPPDPMYNTKPDNFIVNGNRLYFTVGLKLYCYDNIHSPASLVNLNYNAEPSHAIFEPDLTSMNNRLYMVSYDPAEKEGLYVLSDAHSEVTVATCGSYEFNGNFLTRQGTYIDTIPNYRGADSIITLNLTVTPLDTAVLLDQGLLISKDSVDNHQWIDCDNGFVSIDGATGRIFSADRSGHFAVIISNGECTDTSGMFTLVVTATNENAFKRNIHLYPNPTRGPVTLDLGKEYSAITISIMGSDGKIVQEEKFKQLTVTSFNLPESAGIYMVTVTSGNERAIFRIVKN
jgi:ELWxxDGT repeat protein